MRIVDLLWLPDIVEKIAVKHGVEPYEVEEVFRVLPSFRRIERGRVQNEDLYTAMGRTESGRYLIVFFIRKTDGVALIISARDMDPRERKRYGRK